MICRPNIVLLDIVLSTVSLVLGILSSVIVLAMVSSVIVFGMAFTGSIVLSMV